MAIFYYREFEKNGSRNFGDDINPFLLTNLFDSSIIKSERVVIVGIGTLLNKENVAHLAHFERKVVFSSGAGYGDFDCEFDESWDFICVRGPNTRAQLKLEDKVEHDDCDGAILISNFYPPCVKSKRKGIVFIPHHYTNKIAGKGLQTICSQLGWIYLSPEVELETFIKTVQNAELTICEAMHGAILSDTLRVPWIPLDFLHHYKFKWEDWFLSINLDYEINYIATKFNDRRNSILKLLLCFPLISKKLNQVRDRLTEIKDNSKSFLSSDELILQRKKVLMEKVVMINKKYKE